MNQTILVADDDSGIRTVLNHALSRAGYDLRVAGSAAGLWRWIAAGDGDLVITDVILPDENGFDLIPRIKKIRPNLPIIVMSAQNTILTAIRAAERGAFDYLPKPFDLKQLVSVVQRALETRSESDSPAPDSIDERQPLIGRSPAMQEIYRTVARLTQTDLTVMITGESGTGKELVARVLHDYGKRRRGPFVAVNMAAIPKDLIESELFGHERGAFTGAVNRGIGRFQDAEGGTLFLDEIGDMPAEAQTRLLRVLQQGEFTSVGGRVPMKTDVRIVAASNRDVRQLIQQGLFREDLYYRLNVVPIRLPPLRERAEDISSLVQHFLHQAEQQGLTAKHFEAGALELLKRHSWPGNVRELENLVRRLMVLHSGEIVTEIAVAAELHQPGSRGPLLDGDANSLSTAIENYVGAVFRAGPHRLPEPGLYQRALIELERPLISACLAATHGNQIRAAHILGLNRNTLRKKIKDLGLGPARDLSSG